MNIHTVGILSPGNVGHAIGAVLHQHGLRVISSVHDRSPRTQALAQAADISAVPYDEMLVRGVDTPLSILSPASQDDVGSKREEICHLLVADFLDHSHYTNRGVGCARGESTLLGGLGHGERPQTLPLNSPS